MLTVDFRRTPLRAGNRILDVGCGSGRHMGETVRRSGTLTVGTDIHRKDLLDARKRLSELNAMGEIRGGCALAAADITTLPFPDHAFDLVICSEVLEHVPDHRAAIAELVRVLKPGGGIVISVPRYYPEKICWILSKAYRSTPGGHIRIYGRKAMENLIMESGVALRECCHAHSLHVPYWWLRCLLGLERSDALPVRAYHRFLLWDMMRRPWITRFLDRLLNPVLGKSVVFYGRGKTPQATPDPGRASRCTVPSSISRPEKETSRKKKTVSNTPRVQIRPALLPSQRNGGSPDDGMRGSRSNWARDPCHRFCTSALVSSWISAPEWVRRRPRDESSFSSVIFVVLSYIPFSRILSRFSNLTARFIRGIQIG